MKNEILDDLFNDDLLAQLQPAERVIWDGAPAITPFMKWSNILGVIILILFAANIYFKGWGVNLIMYPAMASLFTLWRLYQSRKVRYLITNQRIIFQLWKNSSLKVHSIPLDAIKKVLITDEDQDNGTLLLQMKNYKYRPFQTYNLKDGNERPHISLEMIEEVEQVAQHIETERLKLL